MSYARRHSTNVCPGNRVRYTLMLEGFDFDTPTIGQYLTGKLPDLRRYNALDVPASYFDEAMERLSTRYLNVSLQAVVHPASPSAQRAASDQQLAATAAPPVQEKELTALACFERGYDTTDLAEKARYYDQAIRLKPDFVIAYNNRGIVLQDQGNHDDALRDFNEAMRLKPDYADAYNNRGNALKAQGNLDDALRDFNEAIRLRPDFMDAYYNRGNTLQAQGNLNDALRDYSEAIRLRPDFMDGLLQPGHRARSPRQPR